MRRLTILAAVLLAALGLALAGCGGEETATPTPQTVEGELPTETSGGGGDLPALDLEGDEENGKSIFAAQGCGSCHTLAAAGSSGAVGPNLDNTKPSYELTVDRVTNGRNAMPKFGDKLEAQEIADVSAFVAENAGS